MPFLTARAKLTYGSGKVTTRDSASLNVIKTIPLSNWIIRVEASPIGTSTVASRTHFELNEPVVVPPNSFVQIFPILRTEINKTQTDAGLHLAALRFSDTIVNGRSVKAIAQNEIYQTWKFASNLLNIVSLNTDNAGYGTTPLNAVFKTYGLDISCTIVNGVSQLGDWDYQDLTVEYQAGYPGRSCSFMFVSNTGEIARATDIVVNDPNGVVTVTNHDVNKGVKITSNNKNGLISIRVPARFVNFQCWDDTGQVNGVGYPALKGFRSFGNTLTHILLPIVAYNFEVPTNLPPTLKSIRFGLGIAAAVLFNDPKVSNWDVSNLLPSSFEAMFAYCIDFNQDLSGWCVSQVTSAPVDFSYRAALTTANHPVWGTCPVTPIISVDVTIHWREFGLIKTSYEAGFNQRGPMKINGITYENINNIIILYDNLKVNTSGPLFSLFSQYSRVSAKATLDNGTILIVNWTYYETKDGHRTYRHVGYPNISNFQQLLSPYRGQPAKLTLKLSN